MPGLENCLDKLHKSVVENALFAAGDKLLLAVSGGSDSVALLYLMAKLRSRIPVTLLCCHVNHGLRGEHSNADEALTRDLCLKLNVPFIVRRISLATAPDLENRAREQRFAALFHLLEIYRFDYVVLGHQRDEQAETVLMNMLRGAGISGMAGIKARQGKILHPLLDFGKEELRQALIEADFPWREDESNQDASFRRNRIRLELIPYLQEHFCEDLVDKLYRQSQIMNDADSFFADHSAALYKKNAIESEAGQISFHTPFLHSLSRPELYYLLRHAYSRISGVQKDFYLHSFEGILQLMDGDGSAALDMQNGVFARREYDMLSLEAELEAGSVPEPMLVEEDRARVVFGSYRFSFRHLRLLPRELGFEPNVAVFDADSITWPLTIRMRQPGDRFIPHGMSGTKKLKDFFIDAKVPRRLRDQIPLVTSQDRILWVVGFRMDARALATKDSNKLLQITVEPLNVKPKRAANRNKIQGKKNEPDEFGYFGSPF